MPKLPRPSANGNVATTPRSPALELVDSRFVRDELDAPSTSSVTSSGPDSRRDEAALDSSTWYVVFLSSFLIGLLALGGFWIWLNASVL